MIYPHRDIQREKCLNTDLRAAPVAVACFSIDGSAATCTFPGHFGTCCWGCTVTIDQLQYRTTTQTMHATTAAKDRIWFGNAMCPQNFVNLLTEHTHARLTALFSGLFRWAGTKKVKPIWILLKQETVSGSGISWAICKSAPCSRQTTTRTPPLCFYRPDALPAGQPTASNHRRQMSKHWAICLFYEMWCT